MNQLKMELHATTNLFKKEIQEFKEALDAAGVYGALRYLNNRTPHRYTGIYHYDGDVLRNVALYDKYDPNLEKGEDAPLEATYCSLVRQQKILEINDATTDARVKGKIITPVVSYCGVLMQDAEAKPFGTLCHFDMLRCQERTTDFPLLQQAAAILYQHLALKELILVK